MKPRSCKNKGLRFQREVAEYLSKVTGIPFKKDGDIDIRPMSQAGTDIILRGVAKSRIPYQIECKNQEKLNVWSAVEQAKSYGDDWLLVVRRNHTKPFVVMDMEKFFKRLIEVGIEKGGIDE